jgi:carbonic anhydrase
VSPAAKPEPARVRELLQAGNARFREGRASHPHTDQVRRALAAGGDQADHAVVTVLSCSDSRVPVERIFDAGIMDLFVVRTAGQALDSAGLASLEYGVLHARTPLLVVLGHSRCGAVTAALARERGGPSPAQERVGRLLDRLVPAARRALEELPGAGEAELVERAVAENVRLGLREIMERSPALARARDQGLFEAAGAHYDLATGRVGWL